MDVGSAIIEVVIGLVFVYSLLSLLVTQVNTVIVNLLNLRARHLKGGLEKMITDPVVRAKVLAHPLVRLIEPPIIPEGHMSAHSAEQAVEEGKITKVSYIAPKTFVDVLTDVLASDAGRKLYSALYKATEPLPPSAEKSALREHIRHFQLTGQGLDELRAAINNLSNQQVKQELLQALEWFDATMEKLQIENGELIPLLIGLKQVQNPFFQQALEAVLSGVRSLQEAEAKIEEWFNNSMTRVSDAYTRRMQYMSLGVGFLLALILNVDTLNLAGTLWNDPALRQAVAVAAEESAERAQRADIADPGTEQSAELTESAQRAQATVEDLLDLRLPIGWEFTPPAAGDNDSPAVVEINPNDDLRDLSNILPAYNPSNWFGFLLRKIVGLGVTMIAIAQGAPFWFNLLNRLARGGRTSDVQEEESRG
jgi:hypothetical protein